MKEPFSLVIPPSVKSINIKYPIDARLVNFTLMVSDSVTVDFLRQLAGNWVNDRVKDRECIIGIIKNKIGASVEFY